jgi:hypothetical protein
MSCCKCCKCSEEVRFVAIDRTNVSYGPQGANAPGDIDLEIESHPGSGLWGSIAHIFKGQKHRLRIVTKD